ncbi:MAG: hypothetical protein FJ146_15670 [Deltaproteobacteria bacterium]|nr:hypothetical protein [Deltaproteobacteria bacterium]
MCRRQARNYACSAMLALVSSVSQADGNRFFDSGIDYWSMKDASLPEVKEAIRESPQEKVEEKKQFDWKKYSSPENKEFFKEGDYTPPEPYMEVARNPSDENIRQWFSYIERKNTLTERLSQRIAEYVKTHPAPGGSVNLASLPISAKAEPDVQRYRFRLYFSSTCPHCRKMFGTVNDLVSRGYFVEARQIDRGPLEGIRSQVPVVQASDGDVQKFRVDAVPLLLIADLKSGTVLRQKGFVETEQLFRELHKQ